MPPPTYTNGDPTPQDTLDDELYSYLAASADLKAVLGDPVRAWPDAVPQGRVRPCVTYFRVTEPFHDHLAGVSGLREVHYQFDVWSEAGRKAHRGIVLAVRGALRRLSGVLGSVHVQTITLSAVSDSSESLDDGSEAVLLRSRMDLVVWWDLVPGD